MKRPLLSIIGLLVLGGCGLDSETDTQHDTAQFEAGSGQFVQIADFGDNPGAYNMHLYVPPGAKAGAAAVFAFHGCTQQAAAFRDTGWEKLADEHGFYVVYPEQPAANNPLNCFNWAGEYGDVDNLVRGRGENQSIASMVAHLRSAYQVNAEQVYLSGFSAGGAMAAVILATWPDLFAAGAINSGVPFYCASSVGEAFSCQMNGRDRTPSDWGDEVRAAYPDFGGRYPRVSIWHGSDDTVVHTINQRELVEQWTDVHATGQQPTRTDDVEGLPRKTFERDGVVLVEEVSVPGMAHALAVRSADGCGQAGSFQADVAVCAAHHHAEFFGLDRRDRVAPEVTIDAPVAGETVSGAVVVRGSVSDDNEVARVELSVDGAIRVVEEMPGPTYQLPWDAADELNGRHTIAVTAHDAAGNRASSEVGLLVTGGRPDTEPPMVRAEPTGGRYRGAQRIELVSSEAAEVFYTVDGSDPCIGCNRYTGPIDIAESATLRFLAVDGSGNRSELRSEKYTIVSFDEVAEGSCTEHYMAGRFSDVASYLACGTTHGYLAEVTLYRVGDCWTEDPLSSDCPVE